MKNQHARTCNPQAKVTPRMPLPWLPNPAYCGQGDYPPMLDGDRFLVAVPLHERCGGGFDIDVITAKEYGGFDDSTGESWCAWDWSDVEWYIPLDGPREPYATTTDHPQSAPAEGRLNRKDDDHASNSTDTRSRERRGQSMLDDGK